MFDKSCLDRLRDLINAEAADLVNDLRGDMITEEPDFTSKLVDRIVRVVNRFTLSLEHAPSYGLGSSPSEVELGAVKLNGRPATMRGRNSEERKFGADILLTLESNLSGLVPVKGAIAQAKMKNGIFSHTTNAGLLSQCRDMREVTAESYVFIYAANGVLVFGNPESTGVDINVSNARTVGDLFVDFVTCKVGDPGITDIRKKNFSRVAEAMKAKNMQQAAALAGLTGVSITANV